MGQKKSNFDHLNLGNSIFTGFNDKEGLMICGCEWGFSKKDQRDWENGTYEKAQDVIHTFTDKTPVFGERTNTWPYDNNIKKWSTLGLGVESKRSSENAYSILCLMCSNDF